ncbi:MAG TPA: hypothetical protein GX711_05505 [Clostridia bacterium]|nr:hypothetical protein [Clostridia bacterium]
MASDLERLLREFKVQNNQREWGEETLHVMPAGYDEGTESSGPTMEKSEAKVFRKKRILCCLVLLLLVFLLFSDF